MYGIKFEEKNFLDDTVVLLEEKAQSIFSKTNISNNYLAPVLIIFRLIIQVEGM